jgi:hypothetical protein
MVVKLDGIDGRESEPRYGPMECIRCGNGGPPNFSSHIESMPPPDNMSQTSGERGVAYACGAAILGVAPHSRLL